MFVSTLAAAAKCRAAEALNTRRWIVCNIRYGSRAGNLSGRDLDNSQAETLRHPLGEGEIVSASWNPMAAAVLVSLAMASHPPPAPPNIGEIDLEKCHYENF